MFQLFKGRDGVVPTGWKITGFCLLLLCLGLATTSLVRLCPLAWQDFLQASLQVRWLITGVILLATWICLRLEGRGLASLGLRLNRTFLRDLAKGAVGGFLLMVTVAVAILAAGGFHWIRTPNVAVSSLLKGAWFYLAVACMEEILFRGYLFQRSLRGLGFGWTQILFAVIFATCHWGNPAMAGSTKAWATLNIGLAAVLLGFCWRRTGSLALPIGVHLGWDWTQGTLLGFGVSGSAAPGLWTPVLHSRPQWLTGGLFGLEATLPCLVTCGVALVALWAWRGPRVPSRIGAT